jgi:hypothetical protein
MSSAAIPILVMAAAIILLVGLLSMSYSLDLAGPLRVWLWSRDARRMQRTHRFPAAVHRAYWSRREYDRDSRTLLGIGYRIASEEAVDPYITLPSMPSFGRTNPRPRRRRVPCIYVKYTFEASRLDASTLAR